MSDIMNDEQKINSFNLIQEELNLIIERLDIIEKTNLNFAKKNVHEGTFKNNECIYCGYSKNEHGEKMYDIVSKVYSNKFDGTCGRHGFIYGR